MSTPALTDEAPLVDTTALIAALLDPAQRERFIVGPTPEFPPRAFSSNASRGQWLRLPPTDRRRRLRRRLPLGTSTEAALAIVATYQRGRDAQRRASEARRPVAEA
ncbi:hypothetical protein [Terrabacter sp. Root181]|uniref:hypothetical protein n=1 Tax=Terrabacter sp. Root181 TaxID=1736484 RepID=UPI0007014A0E|nr:hypothetical protein [Terrabacter sp. Root181]KRB44274.1 hypothetical protein ASD90_17940 [Terrabacter sp. Root181]